MAWYLGILLLLWPLLGMGMNNGQVFILYPFLLCVSFFPKTFFHVTNDGLMCVFTCESLLYRSVYRYIWEILVGASLFEFLPLKFNLLSSEPSISVRDGIFVFPTSKYLFQDCPNCMCQVLQCSLHAPPCSLSHPFRVARMLLVIDVLFFQYALWTFHHARR